MAVKGSLLNKSMGNKALGSSTGGRKKRKAKTTAEYGDYVNPDAPKFEIGGPPVVAPVQPTEPSPDQGIEVGHPPPQAIPKKPKIRPGTARRPRG